MNPNTLVFTKREFIDNLEELIGSNEVIICTQNIVGTLQVKKKNKIIPFGFVASAFKHNDGVGDIWFNKVHPFSFCICPPEEVSEETRSIIKKSKV